MKFTEYLQNHDIDSLSLYSPQTLVEICFTIESNLILGSLNKASELLIKYETSLKNNEIYDIFIHAINYESGKYTNDNLMKSLAKDGFYKIDEKIYGLYQFIIGFYFLREGNYDLSKKYYASSVKSFSDQNLLSWTWRSKFNYFLADAYLNDFSEFDQKYHLLISEYESLPNKAQIYFARFLLWLHLFRGNYRKAQELCNSKIKDSDLTVLADYSNYINYIYYEKKPIFDQNISIFSIAFEKILNNDIEIDEFKNIVEAYNISDRYMLAHIYINKIYENKKYSDIITNFDYLINFIDPYKTIVLPPCNLMDYPLFSSVYLGDKMSQENYMFRIRKECPAWTYVNSDKKSKLIEEKINQNIIYFDSDKQIIKFQKKIIDARNMEKMKTLLVALSEGGKTFDLNYLAEYVYKNIKNFNDNENIKALCHRLKKLIGTSFYSVNENILVISEDYTFIKSIPKGRKKKFHSEMIINLLKNSTEKSLTSAQIKLNFNISKRTIIENLNLLITKKRIKKVGHGKNTKYVLV